MSPNDMEKSEYERWRDEVIESSEDYSTTDEFLVLHTHKQRQGGKAQLEDIIRRYERFLLAPKGEFVCDVCGPSDYKVTDMPKFECEGVDRESGDVKTVQEHVAE